MLRRLIDYINRYMCWIKRDWIISPKEGVVKVNIGSGLRVAPRWINVDASLNAFFSGWPDFMVKIAYRVSESRHRFTQQQYCSILNNNIFVHRDMAYGLPFESSSVDYLYSSHLLEHLFKEDMKCFLKESYRILKKGGVFRICIPDLAYVMSMYSAGQKEKALKYFFEDSRAGYLSRHKYMYDYELITVLLKDAGFSILEQCSYQKGKTPDLDLLDNRPEETLYVEAIK